MSQKFYVEFHCRYRSPESKKSCLWNEMGQKTAAEFIADISSLEVTWGKKKVVFEIMPVFGLSVSRLCLVYSANVWTGFNNIWLLWIFWTCLGTFFFFFIPPNVFNSKLKVSCHTNWILTPSIKKVRFYRVYVIGEASFGPI